MRSLHLTDGITILRGDWIEQLRTLPDESAQCCVTSPPYWGLRDYGTASWTGGDPNCDHKQFLGGTGSASAKQLTSEGTQKYNYRDACGKCGAKRTDRQLGLEKTPEEYVAKLVAGFREIRRILKNDGTLWINLGDSYSSGGRDSYDKSVVSATSGLANNSAGNARHTPKWAKPKDLIGIPWMVAFALRADGWFLRSEIIWHKPNPMPESVEDRPTKAHEQIFLLSKNARYFYDAEAIKEPSVDPIGSAKRYESAFTGRNGKVICPNDPEGQRYAPKGMREFSDTRNKRSVWTVATSPYADAHFATYPPDLIKPCILAGSRPNDTIIDPFGGSGTTGMVALELGRNALLIELNPEYVEMIRQRSYVTKGLALT